MEERSSGIILRTRPLTETSLIAEWITPDAGRISTVAKGARRPKSPFLGKLDLFYEADFSFARSRRSELHNLREVALRNTRAELRKEMIWLHQASYFAIFVTKSIERETPVPEIYELLRETLDKLPSAPPNPLITLAFEFKCLALLGYAPDLSTLPGEIAQTAEQLTHQPCTPPPPVSRQVQSQLQQFLMRSIATSLEYIPPQRQRALGL